MNIEYRSFWDNLPINLNKMEQVKIKIFKDKGVNIPRYATEGDAGLDLCANEDKVLMPGETQIIKTGLYIQLPKGYMFNIVSRSGLSAKGVVVGNAFGVIDSGYRGMICIILRNLNTGPLDTFKIKKGDRIAQGFALPIPEIVWEEVKTKEALENTTRGENGFGSTGI